MRLELTGRHFTITPPVRREVEQQLDHVRRLLNDSVVSAQVVLTREKASIHCDATVHARGDKFLHGAASGASAPTALTGAIDKIVRQARKVKGKWTTRKRRGVSMSKAAPPVSAPAPEEAGAPLRIIRARRYAVKPMSIDEAALELVGRDDVFLVFRNAANDAVTVLFKRPDGHLGLIEPEG